jgi:hypothetical protein
MTLEEKLKDAEQYFEKEKQRLIQEMENTYKDYEDQRDGIFLINDVIRCPKCDGFGKLERMDSGYMRKFGLREWDGCKTCGSTKPEEAGRGYIPKEKKET